MSKSNYKHTPSHLSPLTSPFLSTKSSFPSIHTPYNTSPSFHPSSKIHQYALNSIHILSNNINNPRYLGFSQYQSENTFQNSSYCYSFCQSKRFLHKKLLTHSIYNIRDRINNKQISFTKNKRKSIFKVHSNSPPPNAYKIKSLFERNIEKKKGMTIAKKRKEDKNEGYPGPGSYNVRKEFKKNIQVLIKSRIGFYYDDELKKMKHSVSMQRYSPKMDLVKNNRFSNISFGIGDRPWNENKRMWKVPGPGTYNVIGCFERGLKGKLPLN